MKDFKIVVEGEAVMSTSQGIIVLQEGDTDCVDDWIKGEDRHQNDDRG